MIPADSRFPLLVIGSGRLGRALVRACGASGWNVSSVAGRDASRPAGFDPGTTMRAGAATVLLLAVRDDHLASTAARLAEAIPPPLPGSAALHFSGALGLDVLDPLAARGWAPGSCHPLQTFTGSPDDPRRFAGATFAVDGEGFGRSAAESIVRSLGGTPLSVPAGRRVLYHLAASLGGNGLTALVAVARDALVACGVEPRAALAALGPLLRTALDEALERGPESALTGPAARGDEATLSRHRRAVAAWDAGRIALHEALLREQRRLAGRGSSGPGC